MDYVKSTIKVYDGSSQEYEERNKNNVPTEELEKFCQAVSPYGRILDAGCAHGRLASIIAGHGFEVVGIDLSRAFISRARELYPNLSFKLMDVRKLGFKDQCFDGIWCNAVLLHLTDEDINIALTELSRVLKLGGILFVSFKLNHGNGAKTFTADDQRFYNLQDLESIRPLLERHGFEVVGHAQINESSRIQEARDLVWLNILTRNIR